jgi:hypothetical protein
MDEYGPSTVDLAIIVYRATAVNTKGKDKEMYDEINSQDCMGKVQCNVVGTTECGGSGIVLIPVAHVYDLFL